MSLKACSTQVSRETYLILDTIGKLDIIALKWHQPHLWSIFSCFTVFWHMCGISLIAKVRWLVAVEIKLQKERDPW